MFWKAEKENGFEGFDKNIDNSEKLFMLSCFFKLSELTFDLYFNETHSLQILHLHFYVTFCISLYVMRDISNFIFILSREITECKFNNLFSFESLLLKVFILSAT